MEPLNIKRYHRKGFKNSISFEDSEKLLQYISRNGFSVEFNTSLSNKYEDGELKEQKKINLLEGDFYGEGVKFKFKFSSKPLKRGRSYNKFTDLEVFHPDKVFSSEYAKDLKLGFKKVLNSIDKFFE